MEEALLSRHYTESMLLGGYTVDGRTEAETWKGWLSSGFVLYSP